MLGFSKKFAVAGSCCAFLICAAAQSTSNDSTTDAEEGVRGSVRKKESVFMKMVPAAQVEAMSAQQYQKTLQTAEGEKKLVPANHIQVIRLRAIASRLLPYAPQWNQRATDWKWEVNLLDSGMLNAYCMAGGKIAFYAGILVKLQLTDDEVAAVMGHEIAHALREHSRKRMGQGYAAQVGAGAVSTILGLHQAGSNVVGMGAKLLTLKFSRDEESEADIIGMELAARAGYDPAAGVGLWQKMAKAHEGSKAPPEFMSTHPAGERRIQQIEAILPKVQPIYERAAKPPRTFSPALAASGG